MTHTANPILGFQARRQRGFTLVELMAVVTIVGILAALALVGYRRYLNSAKSSEALQMISSIRGAQEAHRAETLQYLNVSGALNVYYPRQEPDDRKMSWGAGSDDVARRWRVLNVTTDGPVYYVYATTAGGPGAVSTAGMENGSVTVNIPAAVEPWYLVQAKGDVNDDGLESILIASSFDNEVRRITDHE